MNNEMYSFRIQRGLTQKKTAQLLGVSTRSIQAIELGDIKLSSMMRARMEASTAAETRSAFIERMVAEYRAKLERSLPGNASTQCDGAGKDIFEYDGSFQCLKCGATWGAITNPDPKTHWISP